MFIMYANTSNNIPSYTHVSSYVVWRDHPPWPTLTHFKASCFFEWEYYTKFSYSWTFSDES